MYPRNAIMKSWNALQIYSMEFLQQKVATRHIQISFHQGLLLL